MSEQAPQPAATEPVPPAPVPTPTPATERKGLAVTALVLGIVAILGSWIPFLSIISVLIGIIGLVFGVIAIVKAVSGKAGGKVMAIVGTALATLAIIFGIVSTSAGVAAVDEAFEEAGGSISASTEPDDASGDEAAVEDEAASTDDEADATDEAPEVTVGSFENPAMVGDGVVWSISQGGDSWDITLDAVEIVPSWSGDTEVAVVTGTATPTEISEGATSSWVSFPLIGWMADGAAVDDTYESPDPDLFADYRHTIDLEATAGTEMMFYSSVGLPEGVVPNLITLETLFGSDTLYISTGLSPVS